MAVSPKVLTGFALLTVSFILLQLHLPSNLSTFSVSTALPERVCIDRDLKPAVKIFGANPADCLNTVKSVFEKLGYNLAAENQSGWEVLWAHPYPFEILKNDMTHLMSHQKVNHFPGSGYITQKANLASLSSEHIPKAFVMPDQKDEFLIYAKQKTESLFVQKSNSHRGIRIHNGQVMDLNAPGTFIQEYVNKPLLISDRKFDIGVYVVLTSIDPLRVYVYFGDVLLRFCKKKYYPFNSSVLESYVVGDDYLPVWEVPALRAFYTDFNYTSKESLNAYLHLQKKKPGKIWSQISQVIQDVYIQTEMSIMKATLNYGSLRNFFELVRFDFVVDDNLDVFLLEANMSPNLSAAHFPPNRLLYEQVIFNVLSIVGLVRKLPDLTDHSDEIEVSLKDIQVFPEECSSQVCTSSCKIQKCKVCSRCLTEELKKVAKQAYLEHMNRNKFCRLIPAPVMVSRPQPTKTKELSSMNHFMDRWFKGKCLQDIAWCQ